jgi:hypothetical protein
MSIGNLALTVIGFPVGIAMMWIGFTEPDPPKDE